MLLWASCYPLLTIGITLAPHLSFATLRALIAGAALVGLAVLLRRPFPRTGRTWAAIFAIGIGATSLGFLGMFHAAEFVAPGMATVIANTQPLMAAVLGGAFLGERLQTIGKIGLLVGFFGVAIIAMPKVFSVTSENQLLGMSYIVLAAIGITVSNVVIKKTSGQVDALMAMGLQFLIGSIPLAVFAGATEDLQTIQWSISFVTVLLTLALLGSALVYVLWMSVLTEVPLFLANSFSFLIPVFGLSLGMLFYGEIVGVWDLAGILLAVIGVMLVTVRGAKNTLD